jgi:cell division protein FtsA
MADGQEQLYIGLDIGTSKVACIVGLMEEDSDKPSIIGVGVAPTTGLRRGVIVDIDETVTSITAAVDEAERVSGIPIHRATISIDGASVRSLNSSGVIAVSHADHVIQAEDVHRVEDAATAVQLPANHEIVQVFPRRYTVDGEAVIKDPAGMTGVRLEVESHIITAHTGALKNLHRVLDQAGVDIEGQVLVPIAAAETVLTKQQKELGVAIVDIGAGTTGVAVYQEGSVVHSGILPIGSGHITNDLAIGLRTNVDTAELIKIKYAEVTQDLASKTDIVKIPELGSDQHVEKRHLDMIVTSRVAELFEMVAAEMRKAGRDVMLPAGVVITGGGANLKGLVAYAKQGLKLPVSVGKPKHFNGLVDRIDDPAFAAPIGLMLSNIEFGGAVRHNKRKNSSAAGGSFGKFKDTLKRFLP